MKKFKFNLERVLKVRKILEEQSENVLLQARRQEEIIKQKLSRKKSTQRELYEQIRGNKDLTLADFLRVNNHLQYNRQQINKIRSELVSQQEEVKKCQNEVIEKRKERQALEKLKEKEFSSFEKDFLQKQQKQLDELGQRINSTGGI